VARGAPRPGQVDERHRVVGDRSDDLDRHLAEQLEGGAENLVAADDRGDARGERRHTELAGDGERGRHVVRRASRVEPVEKPEPLLATMVVSRIRGLSSWRSRCGGSSRCRPSRRWPALWKRRGRARPRLLAPADRAVPRDRELPLSFARSGFWFLDRARTREARRTTWRPRSPSPASSVWRRFAASIAANQSAATEVSPHLTFQLLGEVPVQVVRSGPDDPVPLVDLTGLARHGPRPRKSWCRPTPSGLSRSTADRCCAP